MSWIGQLIETYDNNLSQVGVKGGEGEAILLPLYHTMTRPHIEIVVDEEGNIREATLLGAKENPIIIPCTEESVSRANAPAPHPLTDKLQYLACDYLKYGGSKKYDYVTYHELLEKWVASGKAHPYVKSILAYVSKEQLVEDLISRGILLGGGTLFTDKFSKEVYDSPPQVKQDEAVIRWKVEIPGYIENRTWCNEELFKSWIDFYSGLPKNKNLCMATGKIVPTEKKHPKNINNLSANAKLISSNDKTGYTYRGRFAEVDSVYSIGMEASQKAHLALRWLIEKQGYKKEKKVFLCWSNEGKDLSSIWEDGSYFLFSGDDVLKDNEGFTAVELAHQLKLKILGYKNEFSPNDKASIMILESVTEGRLSILYYQELDAKDLITRLDNWHESCAWKHALYPRRFGYGYFVGAPSPKDISAATHGFGKHVKEKVKYKTVERILACIVEGRRIPIDIVDTVVRRTCRREAFDEERVFDKSLSIACSLYKKYLFDYKQEVISMGLDKERKSRDYLYGRLLAVAQNIESWALSQENSKRLTTADRLMSRFAEHPYTTWKTIELRLMPYINRLKGKASGRVALIDEIMASFDSEEFISDRKLSGEFLLGYHCQKQSFWKNN